MDTELLELDFGPEPGLVAAEARLRGGRRALRRRRALIGIGAAAAVTLGSAVFAALPHGPARPVTAGPAATTSPSITTGSSTTTRPMLSAGPSILAGPLDHWLPRDGGAATFQPETPELVVRYGWTILERVEDPIPQGFISELGAAVTDKRRVTDSVGLIATDGATTQWLLTYRVGELGASSEWDAAPNGFDSFEAWLDVRVSQELRRGTDQLVRFESDRLVPRNGTRIIEHDQHPFVVTDSDGVRHDLTLARLEVLDEEWWVAVEQSGERTLATQLFYPRDERPWTFEGLRQDLTEHPDLIGYR